MQLEYTSPGRYEAYWDGRDRNGNQVASGVYFVQMLVKRSNHLDEDVRRDVADQTPFAASRSRNSSALIMASSLSGTSGSLANWATFPSTGRY